MTAVCLGVLFILETDTSNVIDSLSNKFLKLTVLLQLNILGELDQLTTTSLPIPTKSILDKKVTPKKGIFLNRSVFPTITLKKICMSTFIVCVLHQKYFFCYCSTILYHPSELGT